VAFVTLGQLITLVGMLREAREYYSENDRMKGFISDAEWSIV